MICELANWMDKCISIVFGWDPEPTSEINLLNFMVYSLAFVLFVCLAAVPILLARGLWEGIRDLMNGSRKQTNRPRIWEKTFYCKRKIEEAEEEGEWQRA